MGHLQPLNIFLRQEIDRMRKVLKIVKATLTDLKLAIDGTIIMNEVCNAASSLNLHSDASPQAMSFPVNVLIQLPLTCNDDCIATFKRRRNT